MIRITKNGILIERALVQKLLNVVFEDAKRPRAVLTLIKCGAAGRERICSVPREHIVV